MSSGTTHPAPPTVDRAVRLGRPTGDGWVVRRWLLSRLVTLLLLVPEHDILRDVRYYWHGVAALVGPAGIGDVLREYPAPAMAVFGPLYWLTAGQEEWYVRAFVVVMIAVDAAFTWWLWSSAGRRPTPGVRLWVLLVPCLGPLTFARFDLVSAVLAGGALLALAARRPLASGALAGAGAAVKLWPAALLPALLVRRGGRGWVAAGFAAVGAVAVAATLATGGPSRLLSPLTWQGDRGLQLESLFAVPLLWARAVHPAGWEVPYTRFYAFQVEGPGARELLMLSSAATLAALGMLVWLWWRALRWDQRRPADVLPVAALLCIGTAGLLVVTNKTLSPQYLLWLGGLVAALGCVAPAEPLLRRLVPLLVLTCLVTQVIYPLGYGMLTTEAWYGWVGVPLLTARNALLVVLAVLALRRVVVLTRPADRCA